MSDSPLGCIVGMAITGFVLYGAWNIGWGEYERRSEVSALEDAVVLRNSFDGRNVGYFWDFCPEQAKAMAKFKVDSFVWDSTSEANGIYYGTMISQNSSGAFMKTRFKCFFS